MLAPPAIAVLLLAVDMRRRAAGLEDLLFTPAGSSRPLGASLRHDDGKPNAIAEYSIYTRQHAKPP